MRVSTGKTGDKQRDGMTKELRSIRMFYCLAVLTKHSLMKLLPEDGACEDYFCMPGDDPNDEWQPAVTLAAFAPDVKLAGERVRSGVRLTFPKCRLKRIVLCDRSDRLKSLLRARILNRDWLPHLHVILFPAKLLVSPWLAPVP
jgi:hypothetical protein